VLQILQSLSDGETSLVEVPCPAVQPGSLLIASRNTLVSSGTERMLVDFGKAGYLEKARQQPDKVKQVVDKARTDGIFTTIDAVRSKLDQPLPLGYCNAGVVLESGVAGFEPGDRVASNGAHAEVVRVNKNLCAKIPDNVDDESAAFTVIGAIGLQGIRLLEPTLGEAIVVSGLGLIGLMCVQMLKANGCRVLGIDFDSTRCAMARSFGAETVDLSRGEDALAVAAAFSRGRGVDAVLITASSKSNEVVHQAAEMCRKRGRIVLVGVVGLNLRRDDFFKKELTFQVSASYGPGRYDHDYEDLGQDYPAGFVRWTEQRNFEAVLDMMAVGSLDVKPLITHRFEIAKAAEAYNLLDEPDALAILLQYPVRDADQLRDSLVKLTASAATTKTGRSPVVIGMVGAGNYASRVLIPAFRKTGATLEMLVSSGGVSGVHHGSRQGFHTAASDLQPLLDSTTIDSVVIATRHDLHAEQVTAALAAGKHVFVEKPLALTGEQLDAIDTAYFQAQQGYGKRLYMMVGFNRRFAPHILKMKQLLEARKQPKVFIMTVNAGEIPADHWTQNRTIGGGRIIGEACHFIDLLRYLAGHPVSASHAVMMGTVPGVAIQDDKVTITLSFADGSFGSIHYLANGGKAFPKERLEVFCGNGVLQMDNYRLLRGYSWPGFNKMRLMRQDKGQDACVAAFADAVSQGLPEPIPYNEIMESSRLTVVVAESLRH
jgi:predicted dehydrogenase/threonine dehydrogenase-like Zn-dependent dehydrogenase